MSEPPEPQDLSGTNGSLELRRVLASGLLHEMKEAFRRRPSLSQICIEILGLSMAVVGILLSLYANAFLEREEGDWTVLFGPKEPHEVNLSELMMNRGPEGESQNSPAQDKAKEVVWVLALDVSGSLLTEKITEDDWKLYDERRVSDGLLLQESCTAQRGNTRFHLAREQACCYLHNFTGDRIELWKFGETPKLLGFAQIDKKGRRRDNWEKLRPVREALLAPKNLPDEKSADYKTTNFEKLLDELHEQYINNSDYEGDEIHFVIISDFVHDIGSKGRASYLASMQKIADRFNDIGNVGNAMFHLAAVTAGNREVSSVIRVVEDTAGWYQYRFDTFDRPPSSSMPDFFYSFSFGKPLVFYHVAGAPEVQEVHLKWDQGMPPEDSAKLIVGLMTDVYSASDQDLAVHIAEGRPDQDCRGPREDTFEFPGKRLPRLQSAILRPKGRQTFEVKQPNNHICVKPLSVEKERVYNYKLTLSHAGSHADRKVHVVDIKFSEYLPPYAAWTLLFFTALATVCGLYLLVRGIIVVTEHLRDRPRRSGLWGGRAGAPRG